MSVVTYLERSFLARIYFNVSSFITFIIDREKTFFVVASGE